MLAPESSSGSLGSGCFCSVVYWGICNSGHGLTSICILIFFVLQGTTLFAHKKLGLWQLWRTGCMSNFFPVESVHCDPMCLVFLRSLPRSFGPRHLEQWIYPESDMCSLFRHKLTRLLSSPKLSSPLGMSNEIHALACCIKTKQAALEWALRGTVTICLVLFACFDNAVQMRALLRQPAPSELPLPSNFFLMGLALDLPAKLSLRQQNDRALSSCW